MDSQEWIFELSAEIKELEELLARAEQNNDPEGRWVVHLLRSLLERRRRVLTSAYSIDITLH